MKNLFLLLVLGFISSCTHALHIYHVADYKALSKKGFVIMAEEKQHVIMGFVFQTNYVEKTVLKLENSCSGVITNINTRYSTSHLFLSWFNKVKMTALCVE